MLGGARHGAGRGSATCFGGGLGATVACPGRCPAHPPATPSVLPGPHIYRRPVVRRAPPRRPPRAGPGPGGMEPGPAHAWPPSSPPSPAPGARPGRSGGGPVGHVTFSKKFFQVRPTDTFVLLGWPTLYGQKHRARTTPIVNPFPQKIFLAHSCMFKKTSSNDGRRVCVEVRNSSPLPHPNFCLFFGLLLPGVSPVFPTCPIPPPGAGVSVASGPAPAPGGITRCPPQRAGLGPAGYLAVARRPPLSSDCSLT